jgi:valyl-tRNA synthetase
MHGLVRDAQGRKMSKSLGNGIDPLEVIEKYGTDALRFALSIGNSPGNDLRFSDEKVESARNFTNKIWNASRFVLMNFDENLDFSSVDYKKFTLADKWILSRMNSLIKDITENLKKFELGIALQKIYDFMWSEFCDWYIELVKPRLYGDDEDTKLAAQITLCEILKGTMQLLHPYMPFITEEIYQHLPSKYESIMISKWPIYDEEAYQPEAEKKMETVMEAIKGIRNIRAEMNVVPSRKAKVMIVTENNDVKTAMEEGRMYFERLASASEVVVLAEKKGIPEGAVSVLMNGAEIYLPLEDLVDFEKELERLNKEKDNLEKELQRVGGKLANQGFVAKAPSHVIEEEKTKEKKYQEMLEKVLERINSLKK